MKLHVVEIQYCRLVSVCGLWVIFGDFTKFNMIQNYPCFPYLGMKLNIEIPLIISDVLQQIVDNIAFQNSVHPASVNLRSPARCDGLGRYAGQQKLLAQR